MVGWLDDCDVLDVDGKVGFFEIVSSAGRQGSVGRITDGMAQEGRFDNICGSTRH